MNVITGSSTPLQAILPADPQALELTLFGNAGPLSPGDLLTYTLSLTNSSSLTLTSVTISNSLPVGLGFASAEAGGLLENGNVRWQIPSLIGGESLQLSWQAAVQPGAPGVLVNDTYSAHPLEMTGAVRGKMVVQTMRLRPWLFLPLTMSQE